jgi:hypothetical protein
MVRRYTMNNYIITTHIGNLEIPLVSDISIKDSVSGNILKTAGGINRKDVNSGSPLMIEILTKPVPKMAFVRLNNYVRSMPCIPHNIYLDILKGAISGYIQIESEASSMNIGRVVMNITITEV